MSWRRVVPLLALCAVAGCSTGSVCTEIGCESSVTVTYDPGLTSGPYDLVVSGDQGMLTARCSDPDSMEAVDNPEGLDCDQAGFEITSGPLSESFLDIHVTIIDVETDEVRANIMVDLLAGEPIEPNGPECPPQCFDRSGHVSDVGNP